MDARATVEAATVLERGRAAVAAAALEELQCEQVHLQQVTVLEAQAGLQQAEKAAAMEAADADAETGAAEKLRAARLAEEQWLQDGQEASKRRDAECQQKDAEVADGRLVREVAMKMTEDLEAHTAARVKVTSIVGVRRSTASRCTGVGHKVREMGATRLAHTRALVASLTQ